MTTEIEIYEAHINNSIVNIAYNIYDGNTQSDINQQISVKSLKQYINDNELNIVCTDVILGDFIPLCIDTYLVENLNDVVLGYLMDNLK